MYNRIRVFKAAWQLKSEFPIIPFGFLLKKSWSAEKLRAKMAREVVEFTFRKNDGSMRIARGTTAPAISNYKAKGTPVINTKSVPFYDVEKGAWRSFSVKGLVG